jgi:hypothetical protein
VAAATARRNFIGWAGEDKSAQFRPHNGITGQPNMEDGFHKQRTLSRVATRLGVIINSQITGTKYLLRPNMLIHRENQTTKLQYHIVDHDVS